MAMESQGTVVQIGTLNAVSTLPAADTFIVIGGVTSTQGPSGSAAVIDVSSLASVRREKIMGLPDEGQVSVSFNTDFANAGQLEAIEARGIRQLRNFKITYSSGVVESFTGFVTEFSTATNIDADVDGSMTIEVSGGVTRV